MSGLEERFTQLTRGRFGHLAVLLPIVVLGPGVEVKMDDGGLAPASRGPPHEDRPTVTSPAAIRGVDDELDTAKVRSRPGQVTARHLFLARVSHQEAHPLARGDLAHHLAI